MLELKYKDIEVEIDDDDLSKEHAEQDFEVLINTGIEKLIREELIPWLLNDEFADKDPEKVAEGLKVFAINYYYSRIIAKYSPTKEENFFGHFEIGIESDSEYTEDILEAVSMEVYILNGKVVAVQNYDM